MAYSTLTAGASWLYAEAVLQAGIKAKAEQWASDRIDEAFFYWDRSTWTGSGIPDEIEEIADYLGSGRYLEFARADGEAANGESDPKLKLARTLLDRGFRMIERVKQLGGVINDARDNRVGPSNVAGFDQISLEPT